MKQRLSAIVVVSAVVTLAACSSSSSGSSAKPANATAPSPASQYTRPACQEQRPGAPNAVAAGGAASEFDVTSFDGTRIRVHWFPNPKATGTTQLPTILKGPGWSQPGDTDTKTRGNGIFGDVNIANLWDAGYNVLTWDPRGFGKSGGVVQVDSPTAEGRDAQVLLDFVASRANAQLDAAGDPRVGMVGGSYGGGIQLVLAAIDCRVDAIVPTIAWHSLSTSLYKSEITKQGWGDLLYNFAKTSQLDPHIASAHTSGDATGQINADDQAWFTARGPGDLIDKINVPTLIVQGTVDNLFTLDEAVTNYTMLHARGIPTAMLWYCGGHGVCLTNGGDLARMSTATIGWLARYVKNDATAQLPPTFAAVDQQGGELIADAFPPAAGQAVTAHGACDLALAQTTFAPAKALPGAPPGVLGTVAGSITPTRANAACNVDVPINTAATVLGAPKLTLTYSGTTPPGARPTRVFAQLVDASTGVVVGNQVTPITVQLDGGAHSVTVPLEMIVFSAKPGSKVTLQVIATTPAYAQPRLGGQVKFSAVGVELPTATGMRTS